MRKKLLSLVSLCCFFILFSGMAFAAQPKISYQFNDQPLTFTHPVKYVQGQTLVAADDIADKLNLTVAYDEAREMVTLKNVKYNLSFTLGSYLATVNGKVYPLSVMPESLDGTVYVPLRVVAENAGGIVRWDSAAKTAKLSLPMERIIIFHAGSLSVPLQEMTAKYKALHPGTDFVLESAGSVDCVNKVVKLDRNADIIASADYTVFDKFMLPQYASWYMNFAKNQMVIVYTDKSKLQDKVANTPWYDILLNKDVQFGRTNAGKDPAGYRAMMVWQLAEKHYAKTGLYDQLNQKCTAATVFETAGDLIKALNEGKIDYAFEYLSVAQQNHLKYITLPSEIDLSAAEHAAFYSQAKVMSAGKEQVTVPIINSLTIPVTSTDPEAAAKFIQFIIGPEGQAILEKNGQIVIDPPHVSDATKLPSLLKEAIQ